MVRDRILLFSVSEIASGSSEYTRPSGLKDRRLAIFGCAPCDRAASLAVLFGGRFSPIIGRGSNDEVVGRLGSMMRGGYERYS
jgi:hypothetical protein